MKKLLSLMGIVALAISLFVMYAGASELNKVTPEDYQLKLYKARVIEIVKESQIDGTKIQVAKVKILNRDKKGTVTEITSTLTGNPEDIKLKKGTLVSIHEQVDEGGNLVYYLKGYEKSHYLLQILIFFIILVLIIGRIKGLKALAALGITVTIIIAFIPLLLKGYSPILLSVSVCALSTIFTMLIIAGFSKKSLAAMIGTTGGLVVGGLVAYIYGILSHLTGFSSNDAQMLAYLPENIKFDFRGLLFAGIIIGAMGAAMDVSISIASSLTEIQRENPNIPVGKLFNCGMNVGKDIMGTMVNTLVLAYTGSTLPTLLVFVGFKKSLAEILNLDSIATEIFRAITGSIGLLFTIPITVAAYIFLTRVWKKNPKPGEAEDNPC